MPKCDVLQKILDRIYACDTRMNTAEFSKVVIDNLLTGIRELCEQAIAEKVELKGQRASDKVPTIYLFFDGDDFIVPSPSGNPDEEYFTDNFADAINTYDAMRNIQERAERVVVTLREAN